MLEKAEISARIEGRYNEISEWQHKTVEIAERHPHLSTFAPEMISHDIDGFYLIGKLLRTTASVLPSIIRIKLATRNQ